MPDERSLRPYLRGNIYWVKGNRPDNDRYIRESLGTSDLEVAEAKIREINAEARKRRILGPDAPKPEDLLTFAAAVALSEPSPRDAKYLIPIVRKIGSDLVRNITPQYVRRLAKQMLPDASTDTWQREVITPVRAVINNAHEMGKCPPIRIRAFSKQERIEQDERRGKQSRVAKVPGSWEWLLAFCTAADPRDAALARFMFTKGARIGQSLAMRRKDDMDLSNGRLRIGASKGHPAQWVDIDVQLVAMIANLIPPRLAGSRAYVFYCGGTRSVRLYDRWKATCAKAEIDYIAPHAAGRHGFGTEMIVRQKMDAVTTAKAGRWASPMVPLNTYAHAEDFEAEASAAMAAGEAQARTPGVQSKMGNEPKIMKSNAKR